MEDDVRLKELISSLKETSHYDLPAVIDRSLTYIEIGGDKAHSYLCKTLLQRKDVDSKTCRKLLHCRGPVQALLVIYTNIPLVSLTTAHWLAKDSEGIINCSTTISTILYRQCCTLSPSLSPIQEQLLSAMIRLPDCLANKLVIGKALLQCLQCIHNDLKGGQDRSLAFPEAVLSKAAILGHADIVLSQMVPTLEIKSCNDPLWERVCRSLFCRVSNSSLDSVLTALVHLITPTLAMPHPLYRLLGDLVLTNHRARLILTHKLWLTRLPSNQSAIYSLIGYLISWKEGRELLGKSLQSSLGVWSDRSCVRRMDARYHIWLCKLLVLGTTCLLPHMTTPTSSDLRSILMRGLQVYLECGVTSIRERGLAVGQCIMNTIHSTTKDKQLHFDLKDNSEVDDILKMARPLNEQQKILQDMVTVRDEVNEPEDMKKGGKHDGMKHDGDRDMNNISGMVSIKEASDSDSDNDLEPYDMSNDPDHTHTTPPRYLRDCLNVLVSPKERGPVEATLSSLPSLISRGSPDLPDVSVELARALLHLHDDWDIDSFTTLRHSSLVALTTSTPQLLAPFLTTEFYSPNHNLRQRSVILEVISSAATELSNPSPQSSQSSQSHSTHVQKPWQHVIDERLRAKTRIISKGPKKPPASGSPNRFSPVAPLFFYPLMSSYDQSLPSLDLIGRDDLLLGHLVQVLGNVVWCACHCPCEPAMATALLEFIWSLRYHPTNSVRQAILCALNMTVVATPTNYLLSDMHEAIVETMLWVEDVCSNDGDDEVRSIAANSLSILSAITRGQTLI